LAVGIGNVERLPVGWSGCKQWPELASTREQPCKTNAIARAVK
jgi:hypothetical protein